MLRSRLIAIPLLFLSSFVFAQKTVPPSIEIRVDKIDVVANGYVLNVAITNVGSKTVYLSDYGDGTFPIALEASTDGITWGSAGPCHDIPPTRSAALQPGKTVTNRLDLGASEPLRTGLRRVVCVAPAHQVPIREGTLVKAVIGVYQSRADYRQNRRSQTFSSTPIGLPALRKPRT